MAHLTVPPDGILMEDITPVLVGEITNITCVTTTANPVSRIRVIFEIDGNTELRELTPYSTSPSGLFNGHEAKFVFRFIGTRIYHSKKVRCTILWKGEKLMNYGEKILNLYCE